MLRRVQGDIDPLFLGISRATAQPRLHNSSGIAAVQQQYSSTSASNSGLRDSHGAFVFICVCSVHQEIFTQALNHGHV